MSNSNGGDQFGLINLRELAVILAEEINNLQNKNKNKNKAEAEAEVENEVKDEFEGEFEGENKTRLHVYNGNSYIKYSGNAKAFSKLEED